MEEIVGVECGLCHQEVFHTVERELKVKAKVCIPCSRRIDAEQQEQTEAEMLKGLTKFERKQAMKEQSHDWARSWQGKHVVVTYDANDGHGGCAKANCHIKGTAYYANRHEDVGWGRVKVVLDESELKRVNWAPNEYHPERLQPVIDGYRWGLARELITHGYDSEIEKPLAFYINWGDRHTMILEEVDEEAERLAAKREEERLALEREKEIQRHIGEGI